MMHLIRGKSLRNLEKLKSESGRCGGIWGTWEEICSFGEELGVLQGGASIGQESGAFGEEL